MSEKKLTPKQRRFALAYCESLNASDAYRKVYGATKNADVLGPRLLGKAGIRDLVAETLRAAELAAGLSVEMLERELVRQVVFDPAELFDQDGKLLTISVMPEHARRALVGFEEEALFDTVETGVGPRGGVQRERVQVGVTRRVKWHNKVEAIALGLKRRGALIDRHEVEGPTNVCITFGIKPRDRRQDTGPVPVQQENA